jgi:hypothetical protein
MKESLGSWHSELVSESDRFYRTTVRKAFPMSLIDAPEVVNVSSSEDCAAQVVSSPEACRYELMF